MVHNRSGFAATYDTTTIYFHWLTVFLVIMLWVIGMTADWVPRGPQRQVVWSVHVILGFVTTLVVLARILWRSAFGRTPPPANTGFLHVASEAMHYLLFALLLTVLVTGVVNASYRGFNIFDIWQMPQFGMGDRATRRNLKEWHELSAHAMMIVAAIHAAAALVHQLLWRDRLIDRMRL